ncbi:MAG TPA: NAD-dependent deacylase [Desulfatiglandales bacterium]|nr:NAD-dependent deacylase [Desulfatiglandales bacterium]
MQEQIKALRDALVKAKRVAALTGAGISAESGVPTFRGADGLWRNYNVMELATPQAFARDPELVWEFYNWRRNLITGLTINPGHKALVDLEARVPHFTLITQNVDGLHLQAGSKNLIEIHGNLWKVRCTQCHTVTLDMSSNMGSLPKCRECGGLLRPHVVWFGESLDYALLNRAVEAARSFQVMLVIGTSAIVQPAASLAFEAKEAGAVVAEINLEETPNSGMMDFVLLGKSGEILPKLLEHWT